MPVGAAPPWRHAASYSLSRRPRQALASLWGLARAPRRPLATLTPLGRTDGGLDGEYSVPARRHGAPPPGRWGGRAGPPGRGAAPRRPLGAGGRSHSPRRSRRGTDRPAGKTRCGLPQQPPLAAVLSTDPDGPPAPSRRTPGPRRPRAPPAASQCMGRGSDQRPAAPPCPLPGPGEDAGSAVLPGRPRGCARYPAQGLVQNKCFGALDTHHTTPALPRLHIYVSDGNQSHKWRQIQRLNLKGDRRGRELQVAWHQDGKAAL
ncbi:uncharacterized protein LOC115895292 [Rhinopithecus roxellana]|uniref:uncharacterized protein LOC115895292 n=1 Tax=Rhinopithecus roxellana TaxID=61622 RepID=UPI0012375A38|nr:uncharacterized protein LOC115895292 [Rhinopithecus roxellana]